MYMCTVLYLPAKEKSYFVSLRDENPNRASASPPSIWSIANTEFVAPKDEEGGGTWIGTSEFGTVIVLLNGGFENHEKMGRYIKSRGIIVTELLASQDPLDSWINMNLYQIEPFTLLIWSKQELHQLVWDGINKHKNPLTSTQPYLFSSSTLYSAEAKQTRLLLFQNWIKTKPFITPETILDFFKRFPDKENGFIINRNEKIKTLSYSFIELTQEQSAVMHYYNLQNGEHNTLTIGFAKTGGHTLKFEQV